MFFHFSLLENGFYYFFLAHKSPTCSQVKIWTLWRCYCFREVREPSTTYFLLSPNQLPTDPGTPTALPPVPLAAWGLHLRCPCSVGSPCRLLPICLFPSIPQPSPHQDPESFLGQTPPMFLLCFLLITMWLTTPEG